MSNKIPFKNEDEIKTFPDIICKIIYHQQTCLIGHTKGRPWEKRKIIPNENVSLYIRVKKW